MKTSLLSMAVAAPLVALVFSVAQAQTTPEPEPRDTMRQISTHVGEMQARMEGGDINVDDALRFEPYQQLDEMFFRDDVVFLMRHGPTDWSKLDMKDVAPTDCANQRIMSEQGVEDMRNLGTLMAINEVVPSRIVVSQWCRNQQTLEHLFEGFDRVDPAIAANMPHRTDPGLNLLLSLQGVKTVNVLEELVSDWDGDPERKGPLLLISHYTDIEELTSFRVFEGEILVIDPKRDNQVLGYLRLKSAHPDVGHFSDVLASPLLGREQALDMIDRYYLALNTDDMAMLNGVVAPEWIERGKSPSVPDRDAASFVAEVRGLANGLDGVQFAVDDVYFADDVVTVRGTIKGRHTGIVLGVPATGRDVAFGALAVHRIVDGAIVESWQMADWSTLLRLISD